MGQRPKVIKVTVTTAGTAVRVVTDPLSVNRYVPWCYMEASEDNAGLIYVGDDMVADDNYTTKLDGASDSPGLNWSAFQYPASPEGQTRNRNLIDLYETWVDASVNAQELFVTIGQV